MEIMRIVVIGIVGGILAITVKEYKPELGMCVAGVTGVIILFYTVEALENIWIETESIMQITGISPAYFSSVLKVIGVAYVAEYGAELCRDSGYSSIAVKVELFGKVSIMLFTLPLIRAFLEVCFEAVKLVW